MFERDEGRASIFMSIESTAVPGERERWPWLMLLLGMFWTSIIRIPLILNAEDHLDSDLAVDGLTLLDAVNGHWRWHYPGTPHMGIFPVLSSYAQAMIWGADAVTLVSGGTVLWMAVALATFVLAASTFGMRVAAWAIVPLVFSTVGTIWLSGRITGGHLLTLFWHVAAFVGVRWALKRGGPFRVAGLGFWCGLGVYLDAMFLMTLPGIIVAAAVGWIPGRLVRRLGASVAFFVAGFAVGVLPLALGRHFDPYDAYSAQFAATFDPGIIAAHGRLLLFHCLPRLVVGTELSELERVMGWSGSVRGLRAGSAAMRITTSAPALVNESLAGIILLGFMLALGRLGLEVFSRGNPVRRGVSAGVLLSAMLIVLAFAVNRSIFNSDNYRYLIYLLVPWALGFGLLVEDVTGRAGWWRVWGLLATGLFAFWMSWQALAWYRDTRLYVGASGFPARVSPAWKRELTVHPDDAGAGVFAPRRPWTYKIPADVTHVFGGYWDVYRIALLSGGRIVGIPFPMYPNRFQGWSRGLGAEDGKLLILWPGDRVTSGMRPASETRGDRALTVRSAKRVDWRPAFTTVWELDGRDESELDRLNVVVP